MPSKSKEIAELRVIAKLCLHNNDRSYALDFLDKEEQNYVMRLVRLGLAKLYKGRVYASEKLCQIYQDYLGCYEQIARKCEWPYGRIRECWMEEWGRCLALLP